ncbi:hypothetical protein BC831DRAFT_509272 [Entophlyctis helioformis]|nr:hypothetical protein BC831DRAFT_509272 [Entophlyctis helioformis]
MHAIVLALAASALSAVSAVPQSSPSSPLAAKPDVAAWIDVQPAVLSIDDLATTANTFSLRLTSKPKGPVTVYFEHPSVSFSDCLVHFDPSNWNTTKAINVTPIPVFGQNVGNSTIPLSIRMRAAAEADDYHNAETALPCSRKPAAGGVCSSIGDPHFKSFDGLSYSSQPSGTYHLVKSADLNVQVVQEPCGNGVTCNRAVAVRYGSSVMVYDIRGAQGDKKDKYEMTQVTPNKDGLGYTPPERDNDGVHTITAPCGSTITVSHTKNAFKRLDVTVNLAGGYTKIGGMCNRLPGESNGTLYDASGKQRDMKLQKEIDAFIATWEVAADEDLFNSKNTWTTGTPSKGTTAIGECKIPEIPKVVVVPETKPSPPVLPPYVPPVAEKVTTAAAMTTTTTTIVASTTATVVVATTTVVPSTTTIAATTRVLAASTTTTVVPHTTTVSATLTIPVLATTTTVVTVPVSTTTQAAYTRPSPPAVFEAECESHCKSLFNIPGCASIVDPSFYIKACILDAKATGSYSFTEGAKTAYLAQCHTQTTYMKRDAKPETIKQAETIQKKCGFGNNTCINQCSGHGTCAGFGCACNPGWGGVDCSTDLTKRVQYNVETNTYQTGVTDEVAEKGVFSEANKAVEQVLGVSYGYTTPNAADSPVADRTAATTTDGVYEATVASSGFSFSASSMLALAVVTIVTAMQFV